MAKKSRRVRRRGAAPRLSEAQLVQPTQTSATVVPAEPEQDVAAPSAAAVEPARRATEVDLKKEYQYVVSDMRRLGLLAAIILLAEVAMSFFL